MLPQGISILLEPRACERAQINAKQGLPGAYVPACKSDGTFEQKQCHASTGYCWCVETSNGTEIEGTRMSSTEGEVICGRNNSHNLFIIFSIHALPL